MPRKSSSPTPGGGVPKALAPSPPRRRLKSSSSRTVTGLIQWQRRPVPSTSQSQTSQTSSKPSSQPTATAGSSGKGTKRTLGMGMQGTPARGVRKAKACVGGSSTPKRALDASRPQSDAESVVDDENGASFSYIDPESTRVLTDDPFETSVPAMNVATPVPSLPARPPQSSTAESGSSSYHEVYTHMTVPLAAPTSSSLPDKPSSPAAPSPSQNESAPMPSNVPESSFPFHKAHINAMAWGERLPNISSPHPLGKKNTSVTPPQRQSPPPQAWPLQASSPLQENQPAFPPPPAFSSSSTSRVSIKIPSSYSTDLNDVFVASDGTKVQRSSSRPPSSSTLASCQVTPHPKRLRSREEEDSDSVAGESSSLGAVSPLGRHTLGLRNSSSTSRASSSSTSSTVKEYSTSPSPERTGKALRSTSRVESPARTDTDGDEDRDHQDKQDEEEGFGEDQEEGEDGDEEAEEEEDEEAEEVDVEEEETQLAMEDEEDYEEAEPGELKKQEEGEQEDEVNEDIPSFPRDSSPADSQAASDAEASQDRPDSENEIDPPMEVGRRRQTSFTDTGSEAPMEFAEDDFGRGTPDYSGNELDTRSPRIHGRSMLQPRARQGLLRPGSPHSGGEEDKERQDSQVEFSDEDDRGYPSHRYEWDDDPIDPYGFFAIRDLARITTPEPYRPSSESSTPKRRERPMSPLSFPSTPEVPELQLSSAPSSPSSRRQRPKPGKKRKIWRGEKALERMLGKAPPLRHNLHERGAESSSDDDELPRKPPLQEPVLSEAARRARQERIEHFKNIDQYQLHFIDAVDWH